jgi:hypothetical protein
MAVEQANERLSDGAGGTEDGDGDTFGSAHAFINHESTLDQ